VAGGPRQLRSFQWRVLAFVSLALALGLIGSQIYE
jgi:hypothetical protein